MKNTAITKSTDFADLRNLNELQRIVEANKEAQREVSKTAKDIQKYIDDYADTFLFTLDGADQYLSSADVKAICMNSPKLKPYYKKGCKLSDVIKNKLNDHSTLRIFIDITNKRISYIHLGPKFKKYVMMLNSNEISIRFDEVVDKLKYIPGVISEWYEDEEPQLIVRIDTATNIIMKDKGRNVYNL